MRSSANDHFFHHAGAACYRAVAARMTEAVTAGISAARIWPRAASIRPGLCLAAGLGT